MSNNENVIQITEELEKLAIECTTSAAKLRKKKEAADRLQRSIDNNQGKLTEIQQRIRKSKKKRDNTQFVEPPPVEDCNGKNTRGSRGGNSKHVHLF